MRYFDTDVFRKEQKAFEREIVRNYYRDSWTRRTGLRWEERPNDIKELHNTFEYLRSRFPREGEEADEFRADMERVRNALKKAYDKYNED